MNKTYGVLTFSVGLFLASASQAEKPQSGLKFAGCSISSVAYMKDMAKAFHDKHGVPVDVKGGGVPKGIAATLDGEVQLGGSCRHLLKSEKDRGAVATHVGYDMLVFITHPSNPVDSLTLPQIRNIFSGKITNWKQVGGPDQKILVIGRESDKAGVEVIFQEKVMRGLRLTSDRINVLSTKEAELKAEETPWGVAVTGIATGALRNVKMFKLGIAKPDRGNFLSGGYPMVRPLYLVTNGKPTGVTKQFLDFVRSPAGQSIMSKNAFSLKDYCARQLAVTKSENCIHMGS